jgi:hypothetical protein
MKHDLDLGISHPPGRPSLQAGQRYLRVSPKERPSKRTRPYIDLLFYLATPALGSRLVFPRLFNQAAARLAERAEAAEIPPHLARWYFGPVLTFEVNPAALRTRISDFVRDHDESRWIGSSFLDAADWTAALAPVERSPVHREMVELVAADLDFRKVHAYEVQVRRARAGRPARRNGITLKTVAEIDAYYRYCADLVVSIREHGALPRRKLGPLGRLWLKHRDARPPMLNSAERDIGVAVDRDGELIRHLGGKHRTAIAQALGLPSVPVEVRLVHVDWLARQTEQTGLPAHLALVKGIEDIAKRCRL